MIAVDTSALMAILQREPKGSICRSRMDAEADIVISGVTVAEALIVAGYRAIHEEMAALIEGYNCTVVSVTAASARRVAAAHRRWGKGRHAAGLNFGDCFAYEVAKQHDCPLLFVGDDFAKTDVRSAL